MRLVSFREIPCIRILIPFILGIVYALNFGPHVEFKTAFCISTVVVSAVCYLSFIYHKLEGLCSFLVYGLLVFFGLNTVNDRQLNYIKSAKSINDNSAIYKVHVSNIPSLKRKSTKVEVRILAVREKTGWRNLKCLSAILYLNSKIRIPTPGDILLVNGRFTNIPPPANPFQFDYKVYLFNNGITKSAYVFNAQKIKTLENGKGFAVYRFSSKCQNYLKQVFTEHLRDTVVKATVESLVFGYKDEIPDELTRGYARTGTLHVLAVSGMHVALVFLVLSKILGFIKGFRFSLILKVTVILIAIWMYCIISGLSPSVIRAGFMISFILIGKAINRYANAYNILGITAFLILWYNPFWLLNVGFQLSFAAVLGILVFNEKLLKLYNPENYLLNACWQIISVTLSAQIFTFPLSLYYFNQFPIYFLPANLIIIPLTTLIIYLSLVLLFVNSIPVLNVVFGWLTSKIVVLTNKLVMLFESLPGAIVDGIYINLIQLILIFCALSAFVVFVHYKFKPAFFLSLVLVVPVIIISDFNTISSRGVARFVKFDIPKAHVFLFTNGQESILFKDTFTLEQLSYHVKGWMVHHNAWPPKQVVNIKTLGIHPFQSPSNGWMYRNGIIAWNKFRVTLIPEVYDKYKYAKFLASKKDFQYTEKTNEHDKKPCYIVWFGHKSKILLSYYHNSVNNEFRCTGFKCLKINI